MRGLVAAVLCLVGCDQVFGLDRPGTNVETLPGFDHRKRIRIVSNATEPLVNFPVALILDGDEDLKAGVRDGRDFAVTAANGDQTLSIDLERWDPATGDLVLWVRVPELAPQGETTVYLYYGGEAQGVELSTTWGDAYGAVWHLAGTESVENDSSRHDHRLMADTSNPGSAEGQLGNARKFNGTGDRFLSFHTLALDPGVASFSTSLWINITASRGEYDMPLYKGGASPDAGEAGYDYELGTDEWQAQVADGSRLVILQLGTDKLERQWHHLATVIDRELGTARGYLDGHLADEKSLGMLGALSNTNVIRIGGAGERFEGLIDEVRLYHGAWSSDWIATEYRNATEPTEFLLVSDEEKTR